MKNTQSLILYINWYTKFGLEYLFRTVRLEIVGLNTLSSFSITSDSEVSYYIRDICRSHLRYVFKIIIDIDDIVCQYFNIIDQKVHPGTNKLTWVYLVATRTAR